MEGPVSNRSRMPIRDVAEEPLRVFCELVASEERALEDFGARKFFVRFASKMPPELFAWLFEKRFPLRPFADNLDPRRVFPGVSGPCPGLRKRWRLLKKRLYARRDQTRAVVPARRHIDSNPPADPALDTTLADLCPLVGFMRRPDRVQSAWRAHGKAVTAKGGAAPDSVSPVIKHLYWAGAGSRRIAFWERLVHRQAGELTGIRRLAHEVSRRTGRVVLSWHNGSLGAAGGWAFDDPCDRFESPSLLARFVGEVREEAGRIRESFDPAWATELCSMRAERLFAPKLARGRQNPPIATGDFVRGLENAEFAGTGEPCAGTESRYEWPGALAPHQRVSRGQVRAWIESARSAWAEGLILLFALARRGQRMMEAGVIDSLVLPWIDKFFISSRRQADVVYLERLFRFVSANIESPLVLFWDDTPHARAPSLGLALDRMAAAGLPFRGLGIFNGGVMDGQGGEREQAAGIIAGEYPRNALFALRPMNENHCPGVYRRIFEDFDESFFDDYDSSWKDNLAFLYAGTQVFPLLGTQTEMESVCPWIVMEGKRYAFGAWFRRILRRVSLGVNPGGCAARSGHLHREYCSWANLL